MKRMYKQPALQEHALLMTSQLLTGSNIGEGSAGQQGDVKRFVDWGDSNNGSIFEESPFE